jgi:predicted small secreted protein
MKIKLLILAIASLCLAGCENTMAGFGKDMQKTGQNIQQKANE